MKRSKFSLLTDIKTKCHMEISWTTSILMTLKQSKWFRLSTAKNTLKIKMKSLQKKYFVDFCSSFWKKSNFCMRLRKWKLKNSPMPTEIPLKDGSSCLRRVHLVLAQEWVATMFLTFLNSEVFWRNWKTFPKGRHNQSVEDFPYKNNVLLALTSFRFGWNLGSNQK